MRKLAIASFSFAAAIFAANYIVPSGWLPVCAVLFAVLGAALLVFRRKWLRGLIISLVAMGLGFGCFYAHYLLTVRPANELDGQTVELSGEILDYPQVYDDYCRVSIMINSSGLPKLKALVYDNIGSIGQTEPGQIITFTAKLRSADTRYGEKYDYYNSAGIYLIASAKSEITVSSGSHTFRYIPGRIARYVKDAVGALFPADTAAFMKSLMLGDKSELYQDVSLHYALSKSGFMHVVAVSGMHIAFVVGLIQLIFGATRHSSILCICLVWLFVLVTGGSPSAVRAAVMQTMLLMSPVFRRENDPPTSLAAALALILLINPYAAASVSLQLSFAAIAGIICFSGRIDRALTAPISAGWLKRVLEKPLAVAASSLSVMIFTLPLMAVHFGYVSLLSPLTNVLGLWAVSLCFCGGYIACGLGFLFPALGTWAAWIVAWIARYIFFITKLIPQIPLAAVYIQTGFAKWWLALTYTLFITASISRLQGWLKMLLPVALSLAVLLLSFDAARYNYSACTGVISVLDVRQGQCICAFSGENTLMIDCGGQGSEDNAGETAGAYLASCGRDRVDVLLLTHLHADHANGVTMLLEMTQVGLIIMPDSPNDEDGLLDGIIDSAQRHGVELMYLMDDLNMTVGGIELRLFAPGTAGEENERCIMCLCSISGYDMLVTGDSSKSAERELIASHDISNTELLIAGHHGSRYSCCGELLESIGADTAIISVGYNTYGHPTNETLERLAAYGYNIYRTDLNKTIEIRIGRDYG